MVQNVLIISIHLTSLLYFLFFKWTTLKKIFKEIHLCPFEIIPKFKEQDPFFIAQIFFICNYVGTLWSRGIHYQFIIWFLFSFPFLIEIGQPSIYHWRARHVISIFSFFELMISVRPDYTFVTGALVQIMMLIVYARLLMISRNQKSNYDRLDHQKTKEEFEMNEIDSISESQ